MNDTRNVSDEFKDMQHDKIVEILDQRGVELEIAIENTLRDFNMGTIVRNANAFGVRKVHVIGRRQWNKRGAMATDKYLHVIYHPSVDSFITYMIQQNKHIFAIENNCQTESIVEVEFPDNLVMVFGQEGPGLSQDLLEKADKIISIPQLGSTRSINVGVASGIAMFEWLRQKR